MKNLAKQAVAHRILWLLRQWTEIVKLLPVVHKYFRKQNFLIGHRHGQ